jgi:hypothetical protein
LATGAPVAAVPENVAVAAVVSGVNVVGFGVVPVVVEPFDPEVFAVSPLFPPHATRNAASIAPTKSLVFIILAKS